MGCATSPPPPDDPGLLPNHLLEVWSIEGRVALAHNHRSWHASIAWSREPDRWLVNLSAPLGQGSVLLRGEKGMAVLEGDDGVSYTAPSAEELLERHLGWRIPVSGLDYWVRGLAAPGASARLVRDESGGLIRIEQQGWLIDYRRWRRVDGMQLPDKLFLESKSEELSVRLVIDDWRTDSVAREKEDG